MRVLEFPVQCVFALVRPRPVRVAMLRCLPGAVPLEVAAMPT